MGVFGQWSTQYSQEESSANFAEDEVNGAVRKKSIQPLCPENFSLTYLPDGSVVSAVTAEEHVRKAILSAYALSMIAKYHSSRPFSFHSLPLFDGGVIVPFI